MKIIALLILLTMPSLWGIPPVIYGEDNRKEVYEASSTWQEKASSVAVLVHRSKLTPKYDRVEINQKSFRTWVEEILNRNENEEKANFSKLRESVEEELQGLDGLISFCPEERFTDQPVPGDCSGFLIAPDLLLTAGHCASMEGFCEEHDWIFDFKLSKSSKKAPTSLPLGDVYSCKRIIRQELNLDLGLDYALVQLDRNVKGREPLKIEKDSSFTLKTKLTVIGSPSGLPLKVSGEGKLLSTLHPFFFVGNLDTYKGNSGSPVFNARSGLVEGILVRGEEDFTPDQERMCLKSKRCEGNECQGESVSRILSIPEISTMDLLFEAVISNDLEVINQLVELGIWPDMPNRGGLTPLMQAMRYPHLKTLELLLKGGADPGRVDSKGESALHHLSQVLSENSREVLELLLEKGASLEVRNEAGETPILKAARWLNGEAVKLLIEAGSPYDEGIFAPFESIGDRESVEDIRRFIQEKTLAENGRID